MLGLVIYLTFAFACCFPACEAHQDGYRSVLSEQLDQYCELRNRPTSLPTNQAGPRGLPGPVGPPGEVNYTKVEEMLANKLLEIGVAETMDQLDNRTKTLGKAHAKEVPTSCADVYKVSPIIRNETGGVFHIFPGKSGRNLDVFCDIVTDGGGWTVFQRRMDGSVNFQRNWNDYVNGFGRPEAEFWMGLENINRLLQYGQFELRVDLEDWAGNKIYAIYTIFSVADASDAYRLTVAGYRGTAGDSLTHHSGHIFYTPDKDTSTRCAANHKGAWWYKNCHRSNLNGKYMMQDRYATSGHGFGIEWYHYRNENYHSMKSTEMKFRLKL